MLGPQPQDNKCPDDTQSTHVISSITALRAGIPVSGATRAGVGVEDGPAEMQSQYTADYRSGGHFSCT